MGSKLPYLAGKGKLISHKRGKGWFIRVTDTRVLRILAEISAIRILVGNPSERALRKNIIGGHETPLDRVEIYPREMGCESGKWI